MKKIRIFSLGLALIMLLSFAACGQTEIDLSDDITYTTVVSDVEDSGAADTSADSSESQTSTSSKTEDTVSENTVSNNQTTQNSTNGLSWDEIKAKIPSSAKNKTIKVLSWNEVTDVTGAENVIANFTKETGIKVDWEVVSTFDGYSTKVAALVASKNSPDVVRLRDLDMGLIQVLQPMEDLGYDFTDAAWDSRVSKHYTFKSNLYAVNMRNTLLQQPRTLIYNTNLIGKYDLEDPYTLWKKGEWTWDKFEEICKIFTEETDDTHLAWTSYRWADAADVYGVSLIKRSGDTFSENFTDAKLIKGWQTMTSFVEKGYTNNVRFDRNNFENGKILFFTESPIGVRRTHYYFTPLKKTGSLKVVPLPTVSGGTTATIMGEVEAYGVPQGAPNAELVPYFLRYYLDANNYDKDTFFVNKTVLDVYETLMANDEMFINSDTSLITEDVGLGGIHFNAKIVNVKPAQVASKIETESGYIKAAVKNTNGIISKIK